jgi:predicted transcriptional regulator
MTERAYLAIEDIVRLSVRFALILSQPDTPVATDRIRGRLNHLLDEIAPIPVRPSGWAIPAPAAPGAVLPDAIISLEDGEPYKSLYNHLRTRRLTPKGYRRKWGLPRDYPMIAPNESERLRTLRERCDDSPCPKRRRRGRPRHCR